MIQVLPSDHYAQLEVAHHISCYAFANKVQAGSRLAAGWSIHLTSMQFGVQVKAMEAENQQLKQALTQKTSQVKTLESRLTSTQLDLQESQEKVSFSSIRGPAYLLLYSPCC